jgi:lysophospholipase L1-like esterase
MLVAVTIAMVGTGLVAAEIAVRLRQMWKYGSFKMEVDAIAIDPESGLPIVVPNYSNRRITVNSLGFRGPEIRVPKPQDAVRIAFIGDSVSYCGEVSGNDRTWPDLVTASLRQSFPGVDFDYVNGGVPGYTIRMMERNLSYRIAGLKPDIILIEGGNDFSAEMRELAVKQGIINDPRIREMTWPSRYSLLWHLVEKNLRVLTTQRQIRAIQGRLVVDTATMGGQYRQDLIELVRTAQKTGRLVAILTISPQFRSDQPPDQQMRASASQLFYMPFITPATLINGIDRYNEIVRAVADETGALLIGHENDIPGDPVHFVDAWHLTDAGSRAMAQRVSRFLESSVEFRNIVLEIVASRNAPTAASVLRNKN